MSNNSNLSKIRNLIREALNELELDEERISNEDAAVEINQRKNFLGSSCFGEDLGDLGLMYCVFSFNSSFPLYVYYKGIWYENEDNFIDPETGQVNKWVQKHKNALRPNHETQRRTTEFLTDLIKRFREKYDVESISHTETKPGDSTDK